MQTAVTIPTIPNDYDRTRIKSLAISGDTLLSFFLGLGRPNHIIRVLDGQLPDDARSVGLTHDPICNIVRVFIHSDTFDPVDESVVPPSLIPTMQIIDLPTIKSIRKRAERIASAFRREGQDEAAVHYMDRAKRDEGLALINRLIDIGLIA